ncbi:MAG: hypothetical protein M1576_00355, partial [Deltaproteobacteria bacterium]|nr:hypothetical protein [Deltaproteobacteria bacterium]
MIKILTVILIAVTLIAVTLIVLGLTVNTFAFNLPKIKISYAKPKIPIKKKIPLALKQKISLKGRLSLGSIFYMLSLDSQINFIY